VIIHSQILPLARVEQPLRQVTDTLSACGSTSRPLSQAIIGFVDRPGTPTRKTV
jgi:hypothetical protein